MGSVEPDVDGPQRLRPAALSCPPDAPHLTEGRREEPGPVDLFPTEQRVSMLHSGCPYEQDTLPQNALQHASFHSI